MRYYANLLSTAYFPPPMNISANAQAKYTAANSHWLKPSPMFLNTAVPIVKAMKNPQTLVPKPKARHTPPTSSLSGRRPRKSVRERKPDLRHTLDELFRGRHLVESRARTPAPNPLSVSSPTARNSRHPISWIRRRTKMLSLVFSRQLSFSCQFFRLSKRQYTQVQP